MKFKRVMSLIIVIVLVALIITTLILALIGSPYYLGFLFLTVIVPVLLYIIVWLYGVVNNKIDKQNDMKNE